MVNSENFISSQGYVIAETACGHEGDLKKLFQLIDAAAEAGADAIKFQIFIAPERATEDHPEWDIFNKLALVEKDWREAHTYARKKKLAVFADIFGKKSFSIAKSLDVDGFKVHSEDLLNSFFIAQVAAENKIVMIGVGGAHRIEIYNLLNFLKGKNLLNQIILMTGVQTFPTPVEAHSLEEVSDLIYKYSSFGVKVGFSDHVSGDLKEAKTVPLMALARGAVVIEKHLTIDRAKQWEDYQSALGKDDFKEFVGQVKALAPLLDKIGGLTTFEGQYRKTFKKIPATAKDLKKGHALEASDIVFIKHKDCSIPVSSLNLVGKRLKTDIVKSTILRMTHVTQKVGGIIVARCTSNRLPNKALRLIEGRETIALLIERIKRCKNLDCVVLATSIDPSDDALEKIAKREGILAFRGSLENLSLRFFEAAKHYGIDQIVRITGDDILRDEAMIDKAVQEHLYHSCNVTFTHNMPYGTSSEIFSLNTLATVLQQVVVPSNTEYLEWFLQNDRYFSVHYVDSGYQFDPKVRLTLDYEEDFVFFSKIFAHFYKNNPAFTLEEALQWLKSHPDIIKINGYKTPKYTRRDLNVALKI